MNKKQKTIYGILIGVIMLISSIHFALAGSPLQATLNTPTDDSTNQPLSVDLNISNSDPDGDQLIIQFINNDTGTQIGTNQTINSGESASQTWDSLSEATTYTWYVNSTDITGLGDYSVTNYSINEFDDNGRGPVMEQIDNTHYLITYEGPGTDSSAMILEVNETDWTTKNVSSTIYSTSSETPKAITKIDNTHYLLLQSKNARIATINLTDWSMNISESYEAGTSGNTDGPMLIEQMNATHYFKMKRDDGNSRVGSIVLEVNLTDYSVSEGFGDLFSAWDADTGHDMEKIDSTHFLYIESNDARVLEVNVSSEEVNVISQIEYLTSATTSPSSLHRFNSTHFISVVEQAHFMKATILEVNLTDYSLSNYSSYTFEEEYHFDGGVLEQLDDNKFILTYEDTIDDITESMILEVNLTDYSISNHTTSTTYIVNNNYENVNLLQIDSNHFLNVFSASDLNGYATVLEVDLPEDPVTTKSNVWSFTTGTKPVFTPNSPTEAQSLAQSSVLLNGTITESNGDPTTVYIIGDGALLQTNLSIENGTTLTYNWSVSEGNHNWTFYAENAIGNSTSSIGNFSIDYSKPIITLNYPGDGNIYENNDTILNFSFTDLSTVNCTFYFDNESSPTTIVNSTGFVSSGSYTHTLTNLAGDTYYWKVYCIDSLTNSNTSVVRQFTINKFPSLTTPVINDLIPFANTDINATTTVTDPEDGLLTVIFRWFVNAIEVFVQTITGVSSGTEITGNLSSGNFSKGDEVSLIVNVSDAYNTTNLQVTSNATVQNTIPVITLNSPDESASEHLNTWTLNATATDLDLDTMTIYIYGDGNLLQTNTSISNGTEIIYSWTGLSYLTSHNWTIVANDGSNSSEIITRNFTITNNAPNQPTLNTPTNGATNQPISRTLNVTVTDDDADVMNVKFYNNATGTQIGSTQSLISNGSTAQVTWSNLDYNTEYFFYSNSTDGTNTTKSNIFNFTTHLAPTASTPNPADNSTNKQITVNTHILNLSVVSEHPLGNNLDLIYYDASDDSIIGRENSVSNGSTSKISWEGLSYNTTYNWYVKLNESGKLTTSTTWNFTTMLAKIVTINNISVSSTSIEKGSTFYIYGNVTGDISDVWAQVKNPDNSEDNFLMSYLSGDIYRGIVPGENSGDYVVQFVYSNSTTNNLTSKSSGITVDVREPEGTSNPTGGGGGSDDECNGNEDCDANEQCINGQCIVTDLTECVNTSDCVDKYGVKYYCNSLNKCVLNETKSIESCNFNGKCEPNLGEWWWNCPVDEGGDCELSWAAITCDDPKNCLGIYLVYGLIAVIVIYIIVYNFNRFRRKK